MLDVSFVLTDPLISDTFDVYRRAETVGSNGRSSVGEVPYPGIVGVVTPQDPSSITRSESSAIVEHAIEINAAFVFREASQGVQPDRIVWRGREYYVDKLYPFSHIGRGHQRVLCVSFRATDPQQF